MASASNAQIISQIAADQAYTYWELAVAVLIFYEYLVTLPTEVEVIWTRKLANSTSLLFIVNRYNTLVQSVVAVTSLNLQITTTEGCQVWAVLLNVPILIFFVSWALFCALRAYSINNRNTHYAAIVLGLGLIPFGVNVYPVIVQIISSSLFEGQCNNRLPLSVLWDDIFAVASRVSLILCDTMVLYATLSNTYALRRSNSLSQVKAPLLDLLIRNGTLYFGLALVLNCIQIALWSSNRFEFFGALTIRASSIIISRFILQLRKIYYSSTRPNFLNAQYSEPSHHSSVHFALTGSQSIDMHQSRISLHLVESGQGCEAEIHTHVLGDDTYRREISVPYGAEERRSLQEWHM